MTKHSMTVFVEGDRTPVARCGTCDLNLTGSYEIEMHIEHAAEQNAALTAALKRLSLAAKDDTDSHYRDDLRGRGRNAMKFQIRERCICGAEFEFRGGIYDADREIKLWRYSHPCSQLRPDKPRDEMKL